MATPTEDMNTKLKQISATFVGYKREPSIKADEEEQGMEPADRTVKRIKFAPETVSKESFMPLSKSRKKPKKQDKNKSISGIWVRLSEEGRYDHLREVLNQFGLNTDQAIRDYFTKEGPYLLRCGTLHWKDPKPLGFICDYVPKDLLKEVLREENYANIQGFLLGHTYLEEKELVDDARLKERHEKLGYLLKVDLEGLEAFMDSDFFEARLGPGVKTSFREAVETCKANRAGYK